MNKLAHPGQARSRRGSTALEGETSCPADGRPPSGNAIFPPLSRVHFAASYPEGPHKLRHNLAAHPLLALNALADLAERLPARSVEHRPGNRPKRAKSKSAAEDLTVRETIRGIGSGESWAVLRNIEQEPAYAALLGALFGELGAEIAARTGKIVRPQASIFASGPHTSAPFRFDPEHAILLQLSGERTVTVFPASELTGTTHRQLEAAHGGASPIPGWADDPACHGASFRLVPGEAIYVPVMAPHHMTTGDGPSVSLSIGWGSAWSSAEADARALNAFLRSRGVDPKPPGRWPERNTAKAIAWRVLRRVPGLNLNAG